MQIQPPTPPAQRLDGSMGTALSACASRRIPHGCHLRKPVAASEPQIADM